MSTDCYQHAGQTTRKLIRLHHANAVGDFATAYDLGEELRQALPATSSDELKEYLVATLLVSAIQQGEGDQAYPSLRDFLESSLKGESPSLALRLLAAQFAH